MELEGRPPFHGAACDNMSLRSLFDSEDLVIGFAIERERSKLESYSTRYSRLGGASLRRPFLAAK